eukprot:CAMPEP_0176157446 /NCGR_PEP_ID=MMETSP0120_2-20121206/80493_1 /TAXON_ID=160619 /ORGANISM="Kryptoperidinium foliaceum, Strain CCMP 1326" /LENGTH=35 /DNA_ID= /DNA_START= /DNA_END= /DNA_ORIENTATION=
MEGGSQRSSRSAASSRTNSNRVRSKAAMEEEASSS